MKKIGFGGGCHWCTEAYFQILKGVNKVEQGWISSNNEHSDLSEAVIVHYEESIISLNILITVHLHTHSSTSNHSLRAKYRSAVYTFEEHQIHLAYSTIRELQSDFEKPIITRVLPFQSFKLNEQDQLNYFQKHSDNQFCKNYIHPKLKFIIQKFSQQLKENDPIKKIKL